jgi:hypothetical protein
MSGPKSIGEGVAELMRAAREDALREAAAVCDRTANDQAELGDMNGYRAILKVRAGIFALIQKDGEKP